MISAMDEDPSSSTSQSRYLSSSEILEAMFLLRRSVIAEALPLLHRMYEDNHLRFGYEDTVVHHRSMVRGLVSGGLMGEALVLARSQKTRPWKVDWYFLITKAVKHYPERVDEVVDAIRAQRPLSDKEYAYLIKHLRLQLTGGVIGLETGRERFRETLEEIEKLGLKLNRKGRVEYVRVRLALGDLKQAEEFVEWWKREVTEGRVGLSAEAPDLTTAQVDLAIYKDDRDGMIALCKGLEQNGIRPPIEAMAYLAKGRLKGVNSSSAVEMVRAVDESEREMGTEATVSLWTSLIEQVTDRSLDDPTLDSAVEMYDNARSRGVVVDLKLARSLIYPLCSPSPPRLRQALEVYYDLIGSEPPVTDLDSRKTLSDIYHALLDSCGKTPQTFDTAIRLVHDMRSRGIAFESHHQPSALIFHLMRIAPDHNSAFKIYSLIHSLDPSVLNHDDFEAIAISLLQLSWDKSPFVPVNLLIEMMKDMHRAGYQPGPKILTSLLKQYGTQASAIRHLDQEGDTKRSVRLGITQSIDSLHRRIKLDPMIEVDIPLLNALMDAYQRVSAWADAFEVWEELVDRRSRENPETVKEEYGPTMSIILDTCGWALLPHRARKIWAWARRHDLVGTTKIWNGYIECLCRCGEMDQALEIVFEEMREGVEGACRPDFATCQILLKFSWRDERWFRDVQERVKRRFPEWWEDLKDIVEKD